MPNHRRTHPTVSGRVHIDENINRQGNRRYSVESTALKKEKSARRGWRRTALWQGASAPGKFNPLLLIYGPLLLTHKSLLSIYRLLLSVYVPYWLIRELLSLIYTSLFGRFAIHFRLFTLDRGFV